MPIPVVALHVPSERTGCGNMRLCRYARIILLPARAQTVGKCRDVLAPHLLGRQFPIEFPRYHAESRADVLAWQRILRSFSKCIVFGAGESLCDWNRYLFEGSQGCVGQLLRWLRATLAIQMSEGAPCLTRQSLEGARTPAYQELAILAEIVAGEQHLLRVANAVAGGHQHSAASTGGATQPAHEKKSENRKRKPFQRKSRRNKVGGRV